MKKMLKHLLTKRGENINDTPLCDYPRPSLKRNSYFCLNGKWEFGFDKKEIIVPFCPESLLSGINETFEKIDTIERDLNNLIYDIYELNQEEIELVEHNLD